MGAGHGLANQSAARRGHRGRTAPPAGLTAAPRGRPTQPGLGQPGVSVAGLLITAGGGLAFRAGLQEGVPGRLPVAAPSRAPLAPRVFDSETQNLHATSALNLVPEKQLPPEYSCQVWERVIGCQEIAGGKKSTIG